MATGVSASSTIVTVVMLVACAGCADHAASAPRLADAVTHPHGGSENAYPDGFAGLVVDQRHRSMRLWWKGPVPASTAATLARGARCIHVELHEDAAFSIREMARADDRLVGSADLVAGTRISAAMPSSDGSGITLYYDDDTVPAAQVAKAAEALTGVRVLTARPGGPAEL